MKIERIISRIEKKTDAYIPNPLCFLKKVPISLVYSMFTKFIILPITIASTPHTRKALLQKMEVSVMVFWLISMAIAMMILGVEKTVSAYPSSLIRISPPAFSLLENDLEVIPEDKKRRMLRP